MNINPIMTPTTVPRSDNSTAGSEIIDQEPAINLQYTNSLSARTPEEVSDKQSDCTLSDDEMGSKEADAGFEFRHQFDDLYNGFHNPYNPLSEETPKLPAYHPSFFLAEVYCGEILAEALELLKSSGYRDGVIRGVIDRILTDLRVEYPSPRRIGLIGDSGVGKY